MTKEFGNFCCFHSSNNKTIHLWIVVNQHCGLHSDNNILLFPVLASPLVTQRKIMNSISYRDVPEVSELRSVLVKKNNLNSQFSLNRMSYTEQRFGKCWSVRCRDFPTQVITCWILLVLPFLCHHRMTCEIIFLRQISNASFHTSQREMSKLQVHWFPLHNFLLIQLS